MILEKIFEVTLNVNNPINFCTNTKHHVIIELNNIYVNKCYLGTYIIDIIDILQISSCRIITTNSSSNGIIDVKFSAKVFKLSYLDILVGIEIEKNQSLITGKYKKPKLTIDVIFKPTNIQSNLLALGQLVPIRVIKAIHKPRESKIAVAAVLLTCDKKIQAYRVKGEINKSAIPDIQFLFNKIREELNLRKNIDKNVLMFFESLLWSYNNIPSSTEVIPFDNEQWEGPKVDKKDLNTVNIFDTLNMNLTGFWSRPLLLFRSCPLLVQSQEKPDYEYELSAPHLIILEFAKNILTTLTAIREFTEVYNTPEIIKKHENIWNIMRQSQLI